MTIGESYRLIEIKPYTVGLTFSQAKLVVEYGKYTLAQIEDAATKLITVGNAPDSNDKIAEAVSKFRVFTGLFEDAGEGKLRVNLDTAKMAKEDATLAAALANYQFGAAEMDLVVEKADNDITIKTTAKTVKGLKKGKLKKNKSFKISYTVQQGTATFTKVSGNGKIKVSSAGKVTVKKGIKKGTYKVKVKAVSKGNANYAQATATKVIKIKVK